MKLGPPFPLAREGGRRARDLLPGVYTQRRAARGDRPPLDGLTEDRDQLARLQSLARLARHRVDGVEKIAEAPALDGGDEADRRVVEEGQPLVDLRRHVGLADEIRGHEVPLVD